MVVAMATVVMLGPATVCLLWKHLPVLICLIPDKSWHHVLKQLCGIVFVCILDSFQHIVGIELWVVQEERRGRGGECVVYLLVVMGTVIVLSGF